MKDCYRIFACLLVTGLAALPAHGAHQDGPRFDRDGPGSNWNGPRFDRDGPGSGWNGPRFGGNGPGFGREGPRSDWRDGRGITIAPLVPINPYYPPYSPYAWSVPPEPAEPPAPVQPASPPSPPAPYYAGTPPRESRYYRALPDEGSVKVIRYSTRFEEEPPVSCYTEGYNEEGQRIRTQLDPREC